MTSRQSIWPKRRANFLMGLSVTALSMMATPTVRQQMHESLRLKEEDQAPFDVLVVGAATILGLYALYQRGRRDATNFILSSPDGRATDWLVTEGGTPKHPHYVWQIIPKNPEEVVFGG